MSFPQASPALGRALAERNYTVATPVQSAVLGADAGGRDILVSAQTGSGKTVAYGLAIATTILGDAERLGRADAPLALVIAPTRELAMQVESELTWLYRDAGARILSCVGGMDARAERRRLADGVHIVVGTPGRLRDHIERGGLVMSSLAAVVLDEADEMLNMGFREDLEFILDATPTERRTLLFSATMPKAIANLARRYQRDALRLEVSGTDSGHADIEYRAIRVASGEVEHVVVNLLRHVEAQTAIVFCNTREAVRHLQAMLLERGFSAVVLSGELSQSERNHSMQALRDGRARVCVATDVAARGIDLPNVGLVIHAEPPHDAEALQHRSGRTGRAGRQGISALIVPPSRRRRIEGLLRDAGVRAEWGGPPTADMIAALDQERMFGDPLLTQPPTEADTEMAQRLLKDRSPEMIAALLVRMYRSRLPAVEDVTDPGYANERRETRAERNAYAGPVSNAARAEPREREPRAPKAGFGDAAVWFSIGIGRLKKADPKWLLPMFCRKGEIERKDIGAIRILDHETRVEIAAEVAPKFLTNFKRPIGDQFSIETVVAGADARPPRDDQRAPDAARPKEAGKGKSEFRGKPPFKPGEGARSRDERKFGGEHKPRESFEGKPSFKAKDSGKAKEASKEAGKGKPPFKSGEPFRPKGDKKRGDQPPSQTPFRIRKKERKERGKN